MRLVIHLLSSVLAFLPHSCATSFVISFSLAEGMSSVTQQQLLAYITHFEWLAGCLFLLCLCPPQPLSPEGVQFLKCPVPPEVRGWEGTASSVALRQESVGWQERDTGASQGSTLEGKVASRLRD